MIAQSTLWWLCIAFTLMNAWHAQGALNWNGQDWAYGCEFKENNLVNEPLPRDQCSSRCFKTPGCTHYAWTNDHDGTCWMKKGCVSKNDAISNNDPNTVCGVVSESLAKHCGVGKPEETQTEIEWNEDWATGCDFLENNLKTESIRNDQCGPRCLKTPGCTHYTWTNHAGGTCWMKKGCVSKTDAIRSKDPNMVCGVVPESLKKQCATGKPQETEVGIQWNGRNWASGCEFKENNFKTENIPNNQCGTRCLKTPGCTHYTWTNHAGGTCWMKKGCVSKDDAIRTDDMTMACGVVPEALKKQCTSGEPQETEVEIQWNGRNWASGCEFKENNFKTENIPNNQCGTRCLKTPGCTHYTWTNHAGGTCWMKKGCVSKDDAIRTDDMTMACGVVPEALKKQCTSGEPQETEVGIQWNRRNWASGCDFKENNFKTENIPNNQCGTRCLKTPGCTHYTWTNHAGGTCWMKKGCVSTDNAIRTNDMTMACGVVPESLKKQCTSGKPEETQTEIEWNEDWATGCDFLENNLKTESILNDQCGPRCLKTPGCTHYTWTNHAGGTCWLKKGCVSKTDAIRSKDPNMVCGVVPESLKKQCAIGKMQYTETVTQAGASSLQSITLMLHNYYRTRHCVSPLTLDDELNKSAQARAEQMARSNKLLSDTPADVSENTYYHTFVRPALDTRGVGATQYWYETMDKYDFSQASHSSEIESFSNIVWKATTHLGVGYAFTNDRRRIYVVAHYSPKGSLSGTYRENVLPATC